MVIKIIHIVVVFCCAWIITNAAQAQQSQQSIQQQEAAANSELSASGSSATYSTPYHLFQAYYAGVTGTSTAAMYACFDQNALNSAFQGSPPTTSAQFAAMDAGNAQRNPRGYVLQSFYFTADPKSPKITASFTFTVNNPQNAAQPLTIPVTDTLTLIDTPSGWMIDAYQEQ
jgi:hypothetical protein